MQSNQKHFYAGLGTKNLVLLQKNSLCKTNAVKSKTFFLFFERRSNFDKTVRTNSLVSCCGA